MALTVFLKKIIKKIPVIYLLYVVYGFYVCYCIYTSGFVTPDYISVIILAILFQIPIITLDKGWRVNLFEMLFVGAYILIAVGQKAEALKFDELINCLLFTSSAVIIGTNQRKTKIESFDLKRQSLIRESTGFLTGLGSRKRLFSFLAEIENANSSSGIQKLGVIMLDVDYYKRYNDTYGHLAGDAALREVGGCLTQASICYNVSFYRYGGEEFVGVAQNYDANMLLKICQYINNSIREKRIPHSGSTDGFLTVSIGAAWAVGRRVSYEPLLSHADRALYMAKESGRDKSVIYSDQLSESSKNVVG